MDEYIKRADLLELYADTPDMKFETLSVPVPVVRQNILDMPTADVVEVVRCKDCKHMAEDVLFKEMWCTNPSGREVKADDFCSKGERKEP